MRSTHSGLSISPFHGASRARSLPMLPGRALGNARYWPNSAGGCATGMRSGICCRS